VTNRGWAMSRNPYRSEVLEAQLCDETRVALQNADFNGRYWVLQSASKEAAQALLALKLVRELADDFEVTIAGMAMRARLGRNARLRRVSSPIAPDRRN
jgi:hypothetical protein